MWVFTQNGFVSAVKHRDYKNELLVRARDRQSLESLSEFTGRKIHTTPSADYRYRITVRKADFAEWLWEEVDDIEYDNYKNQVHRTRGDEFARPLHEVWSSMLQVDDSGMYRRASLDWDLDLEEVD